LQPSGLKRVSQKHEAAEPQTRKEILTFEPPEQARAERQHQHGSESETHRQKNEHGGMIQRVFDDHKRRTPKQGAKCEREVGFETAGFLDGVQSKSPRSWPA